MLLTRLLYVPLLQPLSVDVFGVARVRPGRLQLRRLEASERRAEYLDSV